MSPSLYILNKHIRFLAVGQAQFLFQLNRMIYLYSRDVIIDMIGVNRMKTLKENYLSLSIIIFAIVMSFVLQSYFNLPLIAGAFIGVLLGIICGFLIEFIKSKRNKKNKSEPS